MLGFIDESGDSGFKFDRNSSPYFVITTVLFQSEEEAEKVVRCIDSLRGTLQQPKLEFHFMKTHSKYREAFFMAVRKFDFQAYTLVVDKKKMLEFRGRHEDFLLETFCAAMIGARDEGLLKAASLKFDETGGYAFTRKLASALVRQVNQGEFGKYISRFEPQRSTGNDLIQLTDMICGARARPYNSPQRKEEDYEKMIKRQLLPVQMWP